MLESKAYGAAPADQADAAPVSAPVATRGGWLADFDFLSAISAFFAAAWSTDRLELRPIPVRVRHRR